MLLKLAETEIEHIKHCNFKILHFIKEVALEITVVVKNISNVIPNELNFLNQCIKVNHKEQKLMV